MSSTAPVTRTVNIYINQASAEASLLKLQKRADQLTASIDKGRQAGKDMTAEIAKLGETQQKIENLSKVVSGELEPQFNQVRARVAELRRELQNMSSNAPGYAEKFAEFQKVNDRFRQMQLELKGIGQQMDNTGSKSTSLLSKVTALAGGYFGLHAAMRAAAGAMHISEDLSDETAQLQIFLHGTTEDAQKLIDTLKKMDTRTSLESLVDISTIVAKKGVARNEIAGVTQALDQLFTVLGSEAGDPHEAIASMVKLVNVYSEDKHVTAKNIGDIGAAIQKLTSSGVATGKFLIDFAERMGGVRGITGITIQSVLGLGAALEELGQRNESAATAAQKLIVQMFLKPQAYAKAAGMSIQEFTQQLSKDPIEALIKVAATLKQTGGAPAELIESFTEMGVTGARVIGVLGDIAGNAEYMRKRANDASKAFGDQASIVAANEIKQRTLAATMDRVKKNMELIAASKGVQLTFTAIGTALLFLTNHLPLLITLGALMTASWVAQNTSLILLNAQLLYYTLMQRTLQLAYGAVAIAQGIYAVGLAALTGALRLAAGAAQGLNLTLMATPLGAIVTVLTTLIGVATVVAGVVKSHAEATRKLNTEQQLNHDINKRAADATADQLVKEKTLLAVLNDKTASLGVQTRALKDLKEMANGHLDNLTLENVRTKEGIELIKQYNQQLRNQAAYEAGLQIQKDKQQKDLELAEKEYTLQQKLSTGKTDISDLSDEEQQFVSSFRRSYPFSASVGDVFRKSNATKDAIKEVQRQRAELAKEMDVTAKVVADKFKAVGDTIAEGPVVPAGTKPEDGGRSIGQIKAELKKVTKELSDAIEGTEEYNALLAKQKQLQDELTHAKGKKTADDRAQEAEERKRQRILEKRKEIEDEFARLKADAQAADESDDALQLQKVTDKYNRLAEKARKYAVTLSELNVVEQQELNKLINKQFDKRSEKEYDQSLKDLASFYDKERQANDQQYLNGEITRQQHANRMRELDTDEATDRATIADDYAATVKKAANDAEKYKSDATKKGIKERENLEEQSLQSTVYEAQRNLIKSPKGSKDELEAQKALLEAKFQQETAFMDKTSAAYLLKQEEVNRALKALDVQYITDKISSYLSAFQQMSNVVGNFFEAANQRENAALDQDRVANDKKKAQLQDSLDKKKISQEQYNKAIKKLDDDLAQKQHELQVKQFKRQQAAAIISALINGAMGVTQIWAKYADAPYVAAALTAIEVAVIGSEIAKITAQKPPAYAKGTDSAKGGTSLVSEEGPELGVTRDGKWFVTPDNPSLVDIPAGAKIIPHNKSYGVPKWISSSPQSVASNAPSWISNAPPAVNYDLVTQSMRATQRMYAKSASTGSSSSDTQQMFSEEDRAVMRDFIKQMKDGVQASIYWNDLDKMNRQHKALIQAGSKKP